LIGPDRGAGRSPPPAVALGSGAINQSGDTIEIVMVQPADKTSVIMIRWPDAPQSPHRPHSTQPPLKPYEDLGDASTRYTQIRAQRRC
jgi:hypothetical protein